MNFINSKLRLLASRDAAIRLLLTASALQFMAGCGGNESQVLGVATVADQITESPVDIMAVVSAEQEAPQVSAAMENFLANGSFENGKTGWSECLGGKHGSIITDAYDGSKALEVTSGGCIYQSVEVTPGAEMNLSCFVKIQNDFQWTGMGLGFSDPDWSTLSNSPSTVITGSDYARYDVRATAPVKTKYASMWFFTETNAVVDNCFLTLADDVTVPPVLDDINLLSNPSFDEVANDIPNGWVKYCGGAAAAESNNDETDLIVGDGACVAQSLNSSVLAAMQGELVRLSCEIKHQSEEFAELKINLDGTDRATVVKRNSFDDVELVFTAPAKLTRGFVSIYSEGKQDNTRVTECVLELSDVDPTARYAIGDTGLGGGIVFQISPDGLSGIEIMPIDITGGDGVPFGCEGVDVAGALSSIDSGNDSTQTGAEKTASLSQAGCDAAVLAADYSSVASQTSFDDWFLPTALELRSAAIALTGLGLPLPNTTKYWSSSELITGSTSDEAAVFFANSTIGTEPKASLHGVAPIRYFGPD